jgi:hypothetical protein
MEIAIQNLFPVPLYTSSIGRDFTEEEMGFFEKRSKEVTRHEGNWMTPLNEYFMDAPEMTELNEIIQMHLDFYRDEIIKTSDPIRIVPGISWLGLCHKGDWQGSHSHQNSFLSIIMYVKTAEVDGTYFYRPGTKQWSFTHTELNHYNGDNFFYEAKPGDIVIFPSSMAHRVGELKEDTERITIALNTVFQGSMGQDHGGVHIDFDRANKGTKKCNCKNGCES